MVRDFAQAWVFLAVSSLALSACGDKSNQAAQPVTAGSEGVAVSASTPAAQGEAAVANCAPANGKEDILGVGIGMSEAEARRLLTCANPNYQFSQIISGFSQDSVNIKTVRLTADSGLDKVIVTLAGREGAERVWGVYRLVEFTDATRPTADAIRTKLGEKYGQIDYRIDYIDSYDGKPLREKVFKDFPRIITTADNQRIDGKNSIYSDCVYAGEAGLSTQLPNLKLARRCGFLLEAKIDPSPDNPQLVRYFHTGISNPREAAKFLAEDIAALKADEAQQRAQIDAANARDAALAGNRNAPKM